jgi:arylsulfatase
VAVSEEPWELYNLAADRTETNNLAESNPDKLKELEKTWTTILYKLRENSPYKTDMNEKQKRTTGNHE